MKTILLCIVVAAAPSCALYSKANDAMDKLNAVAAALDVKVADVDKTLDGLIAGAQKGVEAGIAKLEPVVEALKGAKDVVAKGDQNQDGRISGLSEWWAVLAGFVMLIVRNIISDKRKTTNETEVKVQQARLEALEKRLAA